MPPLDARVYRDCAHPRCLCLCLVLYACACTAGSNDTHHDRPMEQRQHRRRLTGERFRWIRPERDGTLSVSLYAYCARLLTAQSLHSRLHGQINQRIPYVCPEPVLSGQINQRLVSACPEPVCSAICSLASAVLDLPALQSAAVWGSSFASIDSYR